MLFCAFCNGGRLLADIIDANCAARLLTATREIGMMLSDKGLGCLWTAAGAHRQVARKESV